MFRVRTVVRAVVRVKTRVRVKIPDSMVKPMERTESAVKDKVRVKGNVVKVVKVKPPAMPTVRTPPLDLQTCPGQNRWRRGTVRGSAFATNDARNGLIRMIRKMISAPSRLAALQVTVWST